MKIAATYQSLASSSAAKVILVLLALALAAFAQDPATSTSSPSKPQEPEYANSFFLLNSDGTLKPLERQSAGVRGKIKAFGFGGAETSYQVQGDHSPVRVAQAAPFAIIVRLENHDVDPVTLVSLYPLKIAKGDRQLLIGKSHFMGSTKIDIQGQQIALEFTKYGQSSVKISTSAPLPPGEYAFGFRTRWGCQWPTASGSM